MTSELLADSAADKHLFENSGSGNIAVFRRKRLQRAVAARRQHDARRALADGAPVGEAHNQCPRRSAVKLLADAVDDVHQRRGAGELNSRDPDEPAAAAPALHKVSLFGREARRDDVIDLARYAAHLIGKLVAPDLGGAVPAVKHFHDVPRHLFAHSHLDDHLLKAFVFDYP